MPDPRFARTYGIEDLILKHLRQRPLPNSEQRQRQTVHAYVVVLPEGAGLFEAAAVAAAAIRRIGLVPQRTLPFAGLVEEHLPGDLTVPGTVEAAVRYTLPAGLPHAPDQTSI